MVSPNETGGQQDKVEPPAYGPTGSDTDTPIRDGLYVLTDKMSRTVLDLRKSQVSIFLPSP